MDAYHPDTLCGTVWDASWPVSAVPGTQRGPKGALDQKFHFFHRENFLMGVFFLISSLTQKYPFCEILANFEPMFLRKLQGSRGAKNGRIALVPVQY